MIELFVFGSNAQGMHGKGAAYDAMRFHGAVRGNGKGLQGKSYAIPTKRTPWSRYSLEEIHQHIDEFLEFYYENPQYRYFITPIACGLAGYTPADIAPKFAALYGQPNVRMNQRFIDFYSEEAANADIESFLR